MYRIQKRNVPFCVAVRDVRVGCFYTEVVMIMCLLVL